MPTHRTVAPPVMLGAPGRGCSIQAQRPYSRGPCEGGDLSEPNDHAHAGLEQSGERWINLERGRVGTRNANRRQLGIFAIQERSLLYYYVPGVC